MKIPAFALNPGQRSARPTAPPQSAFQRISPEPRFGARFSDSEDDSSSDHDYQQYDEGCHQPGASFELTGFERACLAAIKLPFRLAILPITGVCKGYELLRANRFDRLLMADNANELISIRFPDTHSGAYDAPLHARLRWLAQAAAQGDLNRMALFEKALRLPRVQALLESELSAKPVGKMQLAEKIQEYGQHNPRLRTHLIEQVGQSIRRGENWSHFEVVSCNHALRQALAARDVAGVLDALKESKICKSDRRQVIIPERLLMNPHNLEVFVQALGGEAEAKAFIEKMITLDIERDLKGHAYKDYRAELRAKMPEIFADQGKCEAHVADHQQRVVADPAIETEAPLVWMETTDARLDEVAKELTDWTMREYQGRAQFQRRLFNWANRVSGQDTNKRRSYEAALFQPGVSDLLEECLTMQGALLTRHGKMPQEQWQASLTTKSPERVKELEAELRRIDTPEAAKARGYSFRQLIQIFHHREQALLFMKSMIATSVEENLQQFAQQAEQGKASGAGERPEVTENNSVAHAKSGHAVSEQPGWTEEEVHRMAQTLAQETIDAYLPRLPRATKKQPDFWEMDTLVGRFLRRKYLPDTRHLRAKHYGLRRLFAEG